VRTESPVVHCDRELLRAPNATYRIICGVPGHAPAGMFIDMKVDPAAQEPAMVLTSTLK